MNAPTVVNVRTAAGRAAMTLYIGRATRQYAGSVWANPYRIGPDGDRAAVIAAYEQFVRSRPDLLARLPALTGQRLGCWCAPEPCHGEVLARLWQEYVREVAA